MEETKPLSWEGYGFAIIVLNSELNSLNPYGNNSRRKRSNDQREICLIRHVPYKLYIVHLFRYFKVGKNRLSPSGLVQNPEDVQT